MLTRADWILETTGNQTLLSHETGQIRPTLERRQKQLYRGRIGWWKKVGGGTARKTWEKTVCVRATSAGAGRADWQMVRKWSDKSLCLRGQKAKENRKTQIPRESVPYGVSYGGRRSLGRKHKKFIYLFNFLCARYDFIYSFIFQLQLTFIIALAFQYTPQWWDLSGWSLSKKIILKQVVLRLCLGHPNGYVKNAGDKSSCAEQDRNQAEAIRLGVGDAEISEMRV